MTVPFEHVYILVSRQRQMEQILAYDDYGYKLHLGDGELEVYDYTLRRFLPKLEIREFFRTEF